jgi:hypothetical protein
MEKKSLVNSLKESEKKQKKLKYHKNIYFCLGEINPADCTTQCQKAQEENNYKKMAI